jgi:hypothetical protein
MVVAYLSIINWRITFSHMRRIVAIFFCDKEQAAGVQYTVGSDTGKRVVNKGYNSMP